MLTAEVYLITYSLWLMHEYYEYALKDSDVALYVFDESYGFASGCTVTALHVEAVRMRGARILCISATPFDHNRTKCADFLTILMGRQVSSTTEDIRECAKRLVVCRPSALPDRPSTCCVLLPPRVSPAAWVDPIASPAAWVDPIAHHPIVHHSVARPVTTHRLQFQSSGRSLRSYGKFLCCKTKRQRTMRH